MDKNHSVFTFISYSPTLIKLKQSPTLIKLRKSVFTFHFVRWGGGDYGLRLQNIRYGVQEWCSGRVVELG